MEGSYCAPMTHDHVRRAGAVAARHAPSARTHSSNIVLLSPALLSILGRQEKMLLDKLFFRARWVSPKSPGRNYDSAAPVAFMHIPKTSGTALTTGLRSAIKPRREAAGFDRALFGSFRAFDSFVPDERSRVFMDPADLPSDSDFIAGHIAFSSLRQRYGSANYLTVLREPLSRILSHWLFWRTVPDDYLARFGAWADYVRRAREPLKDFLSCKGIACHTDNLSIRMLVWPHRLVPGDDFIDCRDDDVLVNEAIIALQQFAFVDIIENSDMQTNLERWLGRPVPYCAINETPRIPLPLQRPLHSELTAEVLNLMEQRTRLDLRLWEWLASKRIKGSNVETLRRRVMLCNVARQATLMVP
ncbi:MAG TPA: hypothetical protein VIY55_11680 [Acetobacteraceae bacterium]